MSFPIIMTAMETLGVETLTIATVKIRPLEKYSDERGWLMELFRQDELSDWHYPKMSYVSLLHPGKVRGPHEHLHQTDIFAFISGEIELYLWGTELDGAEWSSISRYGSENPTLVIVPPGVVHGYKNIGSQDALVLNFPNCLYRGENKQEPIDEIRHEEDPDSRYKI